MQKGSQEYETKNGATIIIRCSDSFCAFGMEGKKKTLILGPFISTARLLHYKLPDDIGRIYVKTSKTAEWSIDWTYESRSEHLDKTPVELPIGYDYPESLADQMRRFIREEVSAAREDDQGSFEEEDDFTDDEIPLTEYELSDMQEVEEIDWDENEHPPAEKETPKEAAKLEASPPTEEKTVDSAQ